MSVELSRSTKKPISTSMLVSPSRKLHLALFCDAFRYRGVPGVGIVARATLFAGTPVASATHVCYAVCSPVSCQDAKCGLFSLDVWSSSQFMSHLPNLFLIFNQAVNKVTSKKWRYFPESDVFHNEMCLVNLAF